ncbi:MAG TPA: helix-turn-helix transcriptional regulator [Dehalococcoidia bacterium]|nr:helix-turn-helix transcriptional regulator [Dehalococcoidia bacterium]
MWGSPDQVVIHDAIPSIVRWGYSPDSDLVYRALVMLGACSAGELGRSLGMPARRIWSALQELATIPAAMVKVEPGRTDHIWYARSPASLLRSIRRPFEPRAGTTGTARPPDITGEILAAGRFGDGIAHLASRAATRRRLAELAPVTRHEHLAINTEVVFDAQSARSGVSVDRSLLDRGVRMRVLGRHPSDGVDPLFAYGRRPDEGRPDYRQARHVPMKLIVIDRRVAFFPVAPDDFGRGYLEVSQPPLVAALVGLFERTWADAGPAGPGSPPLTLDDRERALIALLAQGHTDVTAARELRISPRTVSNVLRSLMERAGVENRFQLGLALGATQQPPPGPASSSGRPPGGLSPSTGPALAPGPTRSRGVES